MAQYLVFRLFGPLASWGEIAVGESRHSAAHPSRSALLGLLGAALGVPRSDEAGQQQLSASFRFGVKVAASGSPLRDYHTVQVPPQKSKTTYRTRRQELADRSNVGTLLSSREYRCDCVAVIGVVAAKDAAWTLDQVAEAIRKPAFTLYLGRKSCTPALPLAPVVVEAGILKEALDQEQMSLAWLAREGSGLAESQWPNRVDRRIFHTDGARYFWEQEIDFGPEHDLELIRHDQPLSRRRWQFAPRREWVYLERAEREG